MSVIGTRYVRAAAIVLLTVLSSGCVSGLLVRAVTWPGDPGRFWVVLRDTGLNVDYANNPDNETEGECTVVWNGTLIEGMRAEVGSRAGEDAKLIGCSANTYRALWARASWLSPAEGYFDLSVPKSERREPLVLDEEAIAERLGSPPVFVRLHGARFGTSMFCVVSVEVESMRAVLNAGEDKDVFVYVGTGNRYCSFG